MNRKKLESGDIKCPDCGKKCKPTEIAVAGAKVKGWRCKCGYELISPDEIEKAYLLMQAKKQGKNLIKKAGSNPIKKKVAKEAAKKLEKEARKKSDQLNSKAKTESDKIIKKAKEKSDQIIKNAEKEAEKV